MDKYVIKFENIERQKWISEITEWRQKIVASNKENEAVHLYFNKSFNLSNFEPVNIVVLSCFIDEIRSKGYLNRLDFEDSELDHFIHNDVRIKNYWTGDKTHHVSSPSISDLNLWRITNEYKEFYSNSVHDYFKRVHFRGYDLSALTIVLNELYSNVFDHADANENAFSFVRYEKNARKIKIAICDFGKGIAKTLRDKHSEYKDDCIALENSIKIRISAQTRKHNRGFGLDTVVSNLQKGGILRIVSNKAFLLISEANKNKVKPDPVPFDFKGTLIYFEISIDSFVLEEIIEDFSF